MNAPLSDHPDLGRRVVDRTAGDLGTVARVVPGKGGRVEYVIHWDVPTPHQDAVTNTVPSPWFDWAEVPAGG